MDLLKKVFRKLFYMFSRFWNGIIRLFNPDLATLREIRQCADQYDMFIKTDEQFFVKLYLDIITKTIAKYKNAEKLNILDLGCGQGRLSIPLAKQGHRVTGIEISKKAIGKAKEYAVEKDTIVDFKNSEILEFLVSGGALKYDCIICTEVLYMVPKMEEMFSRMVKLLKNNGLLFISVRPKSYYVSYWLKNGEIDYAMKAALNSKGKFGSNEFNWFTGQELLEFLQKYHIDKIEMYGIGVVSGIEGDPQSMFAVPSSLKQSEREKLYSIERILSPVYKDYGRYILACGIKK